MKEICLLDTFTDSTECKLYLVVVGRLVVREKGTMRGRGVVVTFSLSIAGFRRTSPNVWKSKRIVDTNYAPQKGYRIQCSYHTNRTARQNILEGLSIIGRQLAENALNVVLNDCPPETGTVAFHLPSNAPLTWSALRFQPWRRRFFCHVKAASIFPWVWCWQQSQRTAAPPKDELNRSTRLTARKNTLIAEKWVYTRKREVCTIQSVSQLFLIKTLPLNIVAVGCRKNSLPILRHKDLKMQNGNKVLRFSIPLSCSAKRKDALEWAHIWPAKRAKTESAKGCIRKTKEPKN